MFYFVLLSVRFLKNALQIVIALNISQTYRNQNKRKHFLSSPQWVMKCDFFLLPIFCSQYSNIFFLFVQLYYLFVQHLASPSAPATCIVCSLPLSHIASFCIFPTYTVFICQTNFLTFLFCPIPALLRNLLSAPNCLMNENLTLLHSFHYHVQCTVSGCSCPLWK